MSSRISTRFRKPACQAKKPQEGVVDLLSGSNNGHFSATRSFGKKEIVARENDRVDQIFMILSGMVKLISYLPNGKARIVRLHARKHWLGLEALVGEPYEHTAVAVNQVEVACLPIQELRFLERDDPRQYCEVLKQGLTHLTQADQWIADFSTGGIRPRLARLVKYISKLEYGESSNLVELLTVHEMADILGVTPESVSRILAEFKRRDVLHKVERTSNHIYQIDSQLLRHEALQ